MKRYLPLVVAFVVGGFLLPHLRLVWDNSEAQTASGLNLKPAAPPTALSQDEIYARAAQAAYRSVVNIDATQRQRVSDMFDDFFPGNPRYEDRTSSGSGVIVTADGYILTNEHVVGSRDPGKRITVTTPDGKRMNGTLVGADHTTDVALVKVDADNLPAAQIGTSRGLVPGQLAVAIGNPLGLRFTVTHGVVSALGRPVETEGRVYSDLIQHDAFINPGNSGGALVNLKGQVIGINTLVARQAQGIGFAIPIDTALRVADELKRFGKVKRPWLGVVAMDNDAYFVQRFGVPDIRGAFVRAVYRDSPAAAAGVSPGDIITRIGSTPIRGETDFRAAEKQLRIGQTVEVEVRRPDGTAHGKLTVGEAP